MRAMVLHAAGEPLQLCEVTIPEPAENQIRVKVLACALCRTDLHIADGELPDPKLPLIPGHQVVGTIDKLGSAVSGYRVGQRIGIPWLGRSCSACRYCHAGKENLCDAALYTGYQIDGGMAEYCLAYPEFTFPIPSGYSPLQAAPLLCAGLIGYRAYAKCGDAQKIGFYGFGAAAHLLAQLMVHEKKRLYAFTRPSDTIGMAFATALGAVWAGGSDQLPPERLDAAIIFAPVGALVPAALRAVDKGGIVVCAGIHMSDIPTFPYRDLWEERQICSVANLTREDGRAFLQIAERVSIRSSVTRYPLEMANRAMEDLRSGALSGSAVITLE